MAKNKTSPLEDLILASAKLPWWVCLLLAVASYAVCRYVAGIEPPKPKDLQGLTETIYWQAARVAGMFFQYVLPIAFTIAAAISAFRQWKRDDLHFRVASAGKRSALNDMSWREFEQLVGEAFRRKGFKVEETGGAGPDGGVDLVLTTNSEKYLVQCKQWRATKVNLSTVQQLYGVMAARGASGAFVVTSGAFTEDAQRFVEGRNIELIDHAQLLALINELGGTPAASSADPFAGAQSAFRKASPRCPACGGDMERRVARRGASSGKPFWGCKGFPRCRGTVPIA